MEPELEGAVPPPPLRLVVPDAEVVAVEYPGVVSDDCAALERLGGAEGAGAALGAPRDGALRCHLRAVGGGGSVGRSRPVHASWVPARRGLVLTVRARDAGVAAYARLGGTYAFDRLADFSVTAAPGGAGDAALALTPPPLSGGASAWPVTYGFHRHINTEYNAVDVDVVAVATEQQRPLEQLARDFKDAGLPAVPASLGHLSETARRTVDVLKALFRERPVWAQPLVELAFAERAAKEIPPLPPLDKALMSAVAYTFSNGPWKKLWVRHGADPRGETGLRKYQGIEVKLPPHWFSKSKAKKNRDLALPDASKLQGTLRDALEFKCLPPARTTTCQLCDLRDDDIQHLVERSVPSRQCTEAAGWYGDDVLKRIEARVRDLHERMRKAMLDEGKRTALSAGGAQQGEEGEQPAKRPRVGDGEKDEEEDDDEEEDEEEEGDEGRHDAPDGPGEDLEDLLAQVGGDDGEDEGEGLGGGAGAGVADVVLMPPSDDADDEYAVLGGNEDDDEDG